MGEVADLLRKGEGLRQEEYEQRNRSIMDDFHAGRATYTELGRQHRLTSTRIRQIIASEERKARQREARQWLIDKNRAASERMKVIVEHRRAIYAELKATFGWRWRRPSPEITSMLAEPNAAERQLQAGQKRVAERRRLQSLYQKEMKAERDRERLRQAERHQARVQLKARVAKLLRVRTRMRAASLDWLQVGRIIVRDLQRDFIPDSQHWPLVHLGPDGLMWLDQTFRAMVRNQYAGRDVIRVEP